MTKVAYTISTWSQNFLERYFGQYHRHISLPVRVDADKASSTFDAGVLEIRLPKAEEAKPKHIEVKAS